ncbi:uncharacterized protein LOC135324086 [Dromaius novaehollandiae]|uniref:uncharacterized protein LOC135324086 n=1 Tax=Dromaius novaehollandiae TaxID=8790 RepID=UPI00311EF12D
MSPTLGILLLALRAGCQELCTVSGSLPAPKIFLSPSAAQPGDSVLLQCLVNSKLPVVRVVFCRDGKVLASQRSLRDQLIYEHVHWVSNSSSVNYSCKYESRDEQHHMTGSLLSRAEQLHIKGVDSGGNVLPFPGVELVLPLGIAVSCVLLVTALVLLGREAVSALRTQRKQGESRAGDPPEEDLHYASVTARGRPQPLREHVTTYASIVPPREPPC